MDRQDTFLHASDGQDTFLHAPDGQDTFLHAPDGQDVMAENRTISCDTSLGTLGFYNLTSTGIDGYVSRIAYDITWLDIIVTYSRTN